MSEQQQEAADGMGSEAHAATMDMDLGTVNSVEVYQFAKSCDMSAHNINMDLPIQETGHEIYKTHPATMGMFNVDLDSPEKDSALMAAMQTRIDGSLQILYDPFWSDISENVVAIRYLEIECRK